MQGGPGQDLEVHEYLHITTGHKTVWKHLTLGMKALQRMTFPGVKVLSGIAMVTSTQGKLKMEQKVDLVFGNSQKMIVSIVHHTLETSKKECVMDLEQNIGNMEVFMLDILTAI